MAARRYEISLEVLKYFSTREENSVSPSGCVMFKYFFCCERCDLSRYFSRVKIWLVLRESSPVISVVFIE